MEMVGVIVAPPLSMAVLHVPILNLQELLNVQLVALDFSSLNIFVVIPMLSLILMDLVHVLIVLI
jgi:hypothetical protein